MEQGEVRGPLSIWLIGLILGPVVLMLWLGRGRVAIIYLLAQLIFVGLVFLTVGTGFVAPPATSDFSIMALFLNLPINIVGVIHGLMMRQVSLWRPWFSHWHVAIILPLAASWLVSFVVRECFYQPFNSPSGSMIPGLMIGDYFFVSKTAYGYSRLSAPFGLSSFSGRIWGAEPQRGDIAVFKLPHDNTTDYVQRLIGLPGDRIQLRDGVVHLNGEALTLTPAKDIPCWEGRKCNFFRETLPGGRSYIINDFDPHGLTDNTPEYIVPAAHYFMMGDNRDNSLDSRFIDQVGYVPSENLVGPVTLIFWNSLGIRIDGRLQGYPDK